MQKVYLYIEYQKNILVFDVIGAECEKLHYIR